MSALGLDDGETEDACHFNDIAVSTDQVSPSTVKVFAYFLFIQYGAHGDMRGENMSVFQKIICYVILLLGAAGCSANHNTAFRNFDVNDGSGAMVDIKQRAVLVSRDKWDDGSTRTIVCAEPSPDALSAYAAELAAEGGNGKVGASLAAASQEAAAYVGLRTQSIQLLRDAFYRACEGYMGGALSPVQFDILTRRYQRYMVALLGIEQLTGTVKAPPVTLTTEGQASAAQSLSSLRAQKDAIDAKIEALKTEKGEKQAIADGDGDDDEKKAAQKRITEIDQEIADLKEDKAAIETGIKNAQGVVAGGATHAEVSSVGMPGARSEATLEKLSTTVGEIVKEVLRTDDLNALCLAKLSSKDGYRDQTEFDLLCQKNVEALIEARGTQATANAALIGSVVDYMTATDLTASEVVQILTGLQRFQNETGANFSVRVGE
ncbi:hypothetical protein [Hyphococcus sp.]|uniref:hypothetical protein n=2 Tax=Hyphococcus sp. TaxID=2038636 RepID=UPI0035C6F4E9